MKNHFFYLSLFVLLCCSTSLQSQQISQKYEVSEQHPFGMLNPDAPPETADFAKLIGTCDCKSLRRNPDQSWQDTLSMVWTFKYIMNGMAVQDETWNEGGFYATSIRQYHPDSARWVVSFFSYPGVSTAPGVWQGSKNAEGDIVLTANQKSPGGLEGYSRLTFSNISNEGFHWIGEWIDEAGTIVFPFWKIFCKKRR